jgi:hypothetical protein
MLKPPKMSAGFNAENRNARILLQPRRCCSFCRNAGHNISTCNDGRLLEFERLCIYRESRLGIAEFRNWLLNYSLDHPNIVTAYAVRYCGCTVRNYMHVCVNSIIAKISELNANGGLRERGQPAEGQEPEQAHPQREMHLHNDNEILDNLIVEALLRSSSGLFTGLRPNDIIVSMMFLDMILRMREDLTHNRKFNIQTNIVECEHTNECECNICYEGKEKKSFVKLNCGHEFCKDCIKEYLHNVRTEKPQCAFCRSEIKNMELATQDIRSEFNGLIIP